MSHVDVDGRELGEERVVKDADRAAASGQRAHVPVAVLDDDAVLEEVEVDANSVRSPYGMGDVVSPRVVT